MAEKETNVENKKRFKWRRLFMYLLLVIIFIPVIAFFLLQLSSVQNVLVDYATQRINKSIDGEVNIDYVDLSLKKGLKLEGFQLKETNGDTILIAESLNVDLATSLYSLIDNSISINKVDLDSPSIRIVKYKGQTKSNLDLVLEKFIKPSDGGQEGKPMQIDLNELEISDLTLAIIDENSNQEQSVLLKNGSIKINTFLKDNLLDISHLILDQPIIRLKKMERHLL